MKQKKTAAAVIAAMLAGFAAAKAPEIDPALVDTLVAQIMQQADRHAEQSQKPDGQAIRNDAVRRLQTLEVLKNRALKEGLDKDKDVQNRFKIAEASFYAEEYVRFLERSETVSESALRQFYERQIRMIKLQQVSFATEEEARQAQQLLLKGLSFEGLMKRYPNDEQAFDGFIMAQQLPEPLASRFAAMNRGDVTRDPIRLGGRYYLFKLSEVGKNPDAQPFELVRNQLEQGLRQEKARLKIDALLEENGVKP
ncbi:TPA: peptidyl-prolyl cis-trans isomerase [Neisseria meningitidis]